MNENEKELTTKVQAMIEKYKDMEITLTMSVGEAVDAASVALVGAGFVKEIPPGALDFMRGVEDILKQLQEAEDTGQEIVTL